MKRFVAFPALGLLVLLGCDATSPAGPTETDPFSRAAMSVDGAPEIMYSVQGHAVTDGLAELVISAVRRDGVVNGQVVSPAGIMGPVVELVPPPGSDNAWCVNISVTNLGEIEGFNVLVFLRDIGDGRSTFDEINFKGGFGIDCSESPILPWETVTSGNFRTSQRE